MKPAKQRLRDAGYMWIKPVNDYWPSRNKFMYDGRVMTGDVVGFIKKREIQTC